MGSLRKRYRLKRSINKRSKWPARWEKKTTYHESISANSQAALTQQCEHAITAAKQKSVNTCSSVCSPKTRSVHSQQPDECGTGQRQTKRVVFVYVTKAVKFLLVTQGYGGEGGSLAPVSS